MSLTYEQFLQHYDKYGKCINQINKPKKTLNEKQLWSAYRRYNKSENKKEEKKLKILEGKLVDDKWEQIKQEVSVRDNYKCRLLSILNPFEKMALKGNAGYLAKLLDHAHVFGKGAYHHLRYDKKNIILLNRYSHSMLDSQKHPINGWSILAEEKENWWKKILGKISYNILKERS